MGVHQDQAVGADDETRVLPAHGQRGAIGVVAVACAITVAFALVSSHACQAAGTDVHHRSAALCGDLRKVAQRQRIGAR